MLNNKIILETPSQNHCHTNAYLIDNFIDSSHNIMPHFHLINLAVYKHYEPATMVSPVYGRDNVLLDTTRQFKAFDTSCQLHLMDLNFDESVYEAIHEFQDIRVNEGQPKILVFGDYTATIAELSRKGKQLIKKELEYLLSTRASQNSYVWIVAQSMLIEKLNLSTYIVASCEMSKLGSKK
jgi:hypothetical protein